MEGDLSAPSGVATWQLAIGRVLAVALPAGVADLDASLTETHSRVAVGSQAQVTGVNPRSQLLSLTG